jgi:two-component system OmpR family response regulator
MLVLAIEDDPAILRLLERGLSAYGYEYASAEDGEHGASRVLEGDVELVLLDISLPGIDGHEVLRRIREHKPMLPVLMLTARDELRSKVASLGAGADDYLTKPFELEELMARIGALTRRSEGTAPSRIEAGDLVLDLLSRWAWRGDRRIELSAREFMLLEYLLRNAGQVISREQILSEVWEYDFDPGSNSVDVYVRYLRRKLDQPGKPSLISTVRGAGYRFDPPDLPATPETSDTPGDSA